MAAYKLVSPLVCGFLQSVQCLILSVLWTAIGWHPYWLTYSVANNQYTVDVNTSVQTGSEVIFCC